MKRTGVLERLADEFPVLTDGAWGTEFQKRGLPPGAYADEWNLSHPEHVAAVARAYVEAGSQIILTNTFAANRLVLGQHGLAGQLGAINEAGVRLSRQAAGSQALVFASVGPTGKMLLTGDTTAEELLAVYREQTQVIARAGADGIVLETMTDIEELKVAVRAAKETGLPVVACLVFDAGPEKDRTLMGVHATDAARALAGAGADVIGSNCGQGIEGFVNVCRRLRAGTDRPIWIKANAGLPEMVAGRAVYRTGPEEFARHVPALLQAGASFIGGCCGTDPDFIRAIARAIQAR